MTVLCLYPGWRRDDQAGLMLNNKGTFTLDGVWFRCMMPNPIRVQCDYYAKSILGLPIWVQAMRSGSVLAVISSAMCAFLSVLATDCTNFANMTVRQKGSVGVACACLELFSGTAIGICVSLYAANIKFDYDHPHKGQRYGYEFGPCIYIGWGMWLICYLNSFMYFGLNWRRAFNRGCCANDGAYDEDQRLLDYESPMSPPPPPPAYQTSPVGSMTQKQNSATEVSIISGMDSEGFI